MKNIIKFIAEALDDIDYTRLPDGGSREFTRASVNLGAEWQSDYNRISRTPNYNRISRIRRSFDHGYYNGEAYIEVALLDDNGNYSPNGDLYDLTNDRELPESLDFIRPMLMNSRDYYGELILYFQAVLYRDDGDRDEYGQRMSPAESGDTRELTNAALKIGDQETPIEGRYLDDLYSVFEDDIQDAYVNTEKDYD